jgi:hypothetical protein
VSLVFAILKIQQISVKSGKIRKERMMVFLGMLNMEIIMILEIKKYRCKPKVSSDIEIF